MSEIVTEQTKRTSIYLDDGSYMSRTESVYICQPLNEVMIAKMKDEQHLVFGWANVSIDIDGAPPLDWQGDVIPPDVLEKAAYKFVLKFRESGVEHEGETVGYLIESVMFTKEKMQAIGIPEGCIPEGWWVGFFVPDDEIVSKIKDGSYKMFSIQGKAIRQKV